MLLRGRSHPRAVRWARGVSCGGCVELVRCRTKRTVRTKGNSLETNVEALLLVPLAPISMLCHLNFSSVNSASQFSQ